MPYLDQGGRWVNVMGRTFHNEGSASLHEILKGCVLRFRQG